MPALQGVPGPEAPGSADSTTGAGELTDAALSDEIELVGDLLVAASGSDRLSAEQIDHALGVAGLADQAPQT